MKLLLLLCCLAAAFFAVEDVPPASDPSIFDRLDRQTLCVQDLGRVASDNPVDRRSTDPSCYGLCVEPNCISSCVVSATFSENECCDDCDKQWSSYWQCVELHGLNTREHIMLPSTGLPTTLVYEFDFPFTTAYLSNTAGPSFTINITENTAALKTLKERTRELEERYDALVAYVLHACPNAQLTSLLQ